MSLITKRAIATSLKKLLAEKPLNKIRIIDITEDCGVNRQTFYYHFQDIYDLVDWIYTSEATKALDGKKTYDTWQQGFLKIFEYVLENKNFIINTYHSLSREHLETYLYNETYILLIGVVEETAFNMNVSDKNKQFIADFYKYAFVGIMLEWVRTNMKEDPSEIIEHLTILIQGNIRKGLESFVTSKHN